MLRDEMMKEFYDWHIVKGNPPDKREALRNLNFFAVFSVGCSKYQMPEIADAFSKRLHAYTLILKQMGYKYGKRLAKSTEPGLSSLFTKAFWKVGDEFGD
jgi:hypothetical protein